MMTGQWGANSNANARAARASSSSVPPSPRESGVYSSLAMRQALPSFWREEDEEDPDTCAYRGESLESATALPPQPLQPKRKLWQVALQLRGDELSRLWRRNSTHLAGRVFVWSDYSSRWVRLNTSPEFAQVHFADPLPIAPMHSTQRIAAPAPRSAALARVQEIVDLTSLARPYLGHFPSRWAFGLAASLVTLVGLAALLPRATHNVAQPSLPQAVEQSAPRETVSPSTTKPEPIPVLSLPLIVGAQERRPAQGSVNGDVSRSAAAAIHHDASAAVAAFNPSAARQALSRAASHAHRCVSGDISGSVLVTFEPSGAVSGVRVNALAGDLSRSECIVSAFRGVRIAPFAGQRLVVKKSF